MTHAYYDALIARSDYWKSYSLRDGANLAPPGVAFDAVADAARVTVPAFYLSDALDGAIDAVQTALPINSTSAGLYPPGRVFKMGSELLTVIARVSATQIDATRGSFGTTATSHGNGTFIYHATNSLRQIVRLPLGTEDGHRYFITWDARWSPSYLGVTFNHKAFQFSSGGHNGDQIWLEPQATYGPMETGYIAKHQTRTYNKAGGPANWTDSTGDQVGPGTSIEPLGPRAPFAIAADRWTRFFYEIDQRANDYDVVNAWAADETRDPVQTLLRCLVSVRPTGETPNSIHSFWLEFNSSTDTHQRLDSRDLIAYVRNVCVLRDPVDVPSLLIRPEAGVPVPPDPEPEPPDTPRPDMYKNPRKVIFRHDDRGAATGYIVTAVDSIGNAIKTFPTGLGSLNDDGDVVVDVNVMPMDVGTYRFIVQAVNASITSDPSVPSDEWQRAPGQTGQPRAA